VGATLCWEGEWLGWSKVVLQAPAESAELEGMRGCVQVFAIHRDRSGCTRSGPHRLGVGQGCRERRGWPKNSWPRRAW
jgi:hypothetical protein